MEEDPIWTGFVSVPLDPKNMKNVGELSYDIIELKKDQFPKTVPLKDEGGAEIGSAELSLEGDALIIKGNVDFGIWLEKGFNFSLSSKEAEDGSGTEASSGSGDRQDI